MDNRHPTAVDRPGHGRVGGVDDPVARADYGDDREAIREAQRDAAGGEDTRQHATVYQLADGGERPREIRHDPSASDLSIGDVVVLDGDTFRCDRRVGWTSIGLREGESTPD